MRPQAFVEMAPKIVQPKRMPRSDAASSSAPSVWDRLGIPKPPDPVMPPVQPVASYQDRFSHWISFFPVV